MAPLSKCISFRASEDSRNNATLRGRIRPEWQVKYIKLLGQYIHGQDPARDGSLFRSHGWCGTINLLEGFMLSQATPTYRRWWRLPTHTKERNHWPRPLHGETWARRTSRVYAPALLLWTSSSRTSLQSVWASNFYIRVIYPEWYFWFLFKKRVLSYHGYLPAQLIGSTLFLGSFKVCWTFQLS